MQYNREIWNHNQRDLFSPLNLLLCRYILHGFLYLTINFDIPLYLIEIYENRSMPGKTGWICKQVRNIGIILFAHGKSPYFYLKHARVYTPCRSLARPPQRINNPAVTNRGSPRFLQTKHRNRQILFSWVG